MKEKTLIDIFKRVRQVGEMNDYTFSKLYIKDLESERLHTAHDFIELSKEYAIQKKGFSVFDEMSESETSAD